jgi:hypothetical protein
MNENEETASSETQETSTEETTETTEESTAQTEESTTEAKGSESETEEAEASTPEPLTAESITVPEGMTLDEGLTNEFLGLMNDQELDPAKRAQGLVDLQAKATEAALEKVKSDWQETAEGWRKSVEADKEIGGKNLDANLGQISKLIDDTLGDEADGLRDMLDSSRLGDHPAFVKLMHRLAQKHAEPGPVSGQPGSASRTQADKMYGAKQ